jgi:SAM-dependent methyltransferase
MKELGYPGNPDRIVRDIQDEKRLNREQGCMGNNDYDSVADLYDIYAQFDFDVGFYVERYAGFKGTALELMAGTGRLSVPLIKSGINLDCVDLSQGLLAKLSEKLDRSGLHSNMYRRDICDLTLPRTYDVAIIGCNSFAEIIDAGNRRKALKSVYSLLNDNGEFVMTLHNPTIRRKSIDNRLTYVNSYELDGTTIVFSIFSHEDENAVVHLKQFYETYDKNGDLLKKKMLCLDFALIEKNEIETDLREAGFKIKELFGNYDKSGFEGNSSPFLICVAGK